MKLGVFLRGVFDTIFGRFRVTSSSNLESHNLGEPAEPSELDRVGSIAPKIEAPDPIPLRFEDLGSSEPEKAVPPSGPAPEPASVKPSEPLRSAPGPTPPHPVLRRLNRRAFNQLFDYFGLSIIPAEAWSALNRSNDPVAAFTSFALQIGCEPERVRRSDPQQLGRMETAIDLLVSLHAICGHLSADGDIHIQASLRSSADYELAEHARLIELLAGIEADRLRAEGVGPCALYDQFLSTASELYQDPLSALASDVEDASAISERFLQSMLLYSNTRANIDSITERIELIWLNEGIGSDEDLDILDGILVQSEQYDHRLSDDIGLTVGDIHDLAEECVTMLRILNTIYSRYAGDDPGGATDDSGIDEFKEALRFFGFSPDSSPSEPEIKKIFREMWKRYNVDDPSHRETEAQKLENERILRELNKYNAILRPKKVA